MKKQLPILIAALGIGLVLFRLSPIEGEVGHDYSHYFARLILGADYFWKNGWGNAHFTPYLCGGMPLYADPQAIYHSIQQGLAFFLAPLLATKLTFFIFYLLGYVGCWVLFSKVFRYRDWVSHFGALVFTLNGFCFMHLLVGHITHYPFLLAPWVLFALFRSLDTWKSIFHSASILVLCFSYTIYSGGLHVVVVFAMMILLCVPFLPLSEKRREFFFLLLLCAVEGFLVLSGKVAAGIRFSPVFYHGGVDTSPMPAWQLVWQYFWFNPLSTPQYMMFGQWAFGTWEFVAFISRSTMIGILLAPFLWFRRVRILPLFYTAIIAFFVIGIATGRLANEQLPFFKTYHNPLKILSAFSPLMVCLLTYVINTLSRNVSFSPSRSVMIYIVASIFLFAEFMLNTQFLRQHPGARGIKYDPKFFENIKSAGGLPPVSQVLPYVNADLPIAAKGGTCVGCYEPLFGYRHETFQSPLKLGSVYDTIGSSLNLHQPACFLYGKENHCQPWTRISLSERSQFERFRAGFAVPEWVPEWQTTLDWLNTITFAVLFLFAILYPVHLVQLHWMAPAKAVT